MGNKKIVIQKNELKTIKDLSQVRIFDESFLGKDGYIEVKLVPVEKIEGFPIEVCIYTKSSGFQILGTVKYALDRPKAFGPMWFKILESIKDVRLTKPVEITLNAGQDCSAIKVISVENTPFIERGENKNHFFLSHELEYHFEELSKEEIVETFVTELNNFLEKAKKELRVSDTDGNGDPLIIYVSTHFPEADIRIVPDKGYCSYHGAPFNSEGKCPKCIEYFKSIQEHAENH